MSIKDLLIVPEDATAVSAEEAEARAGLILALRRRGIGDRDVLAAIERVPRRLFLSSRHHSLAYEDLPLPIECGQSVSAPSHVARVVQALSLSQDHSVLEVGTGSGYQAAVLGHLAGAVVSIDRYRTLIDLAVQRIAALKLRNVSLLHADGLAGLQQKAPYDRIVLTGSVTAVPEELTGQLAPGGILVAPIGDPGGEQVLTRFISEAGVLRSERIETVRVVSLTPGEAERL